MVKKNFSKKLNFGNFEQILLTGNIKNNTLKTLKDTQEKNMENKKMFIVKEKKS